MCKRVAVRWLLIDWLRHDLGLTGGHIGCEQGSCGACHAVVAGKVVRGCLMLAVQADGEAVETIEAPEPSGDSRGVVRKFLPLHRLSRHR